MQRRAVRRTLLALLLVTGLCAAYVGWNAYSRGRDGLTVERDVDARLDRMSADAAALGAAQQAYVAPGQQRGEALTRASLLVQQLYDETSVLRSRARAPGAATALLAFGETVDALVGVDDRVREHLRDGEELMAADLVYTEGRQIVGAMASQLRELKASETAFASDERHALIARGAMVLAGAALVWLLGLLALAHVPRSANALPAVTPADVPDEPDAKEPAAALTVDLNAAASVCTELSRLSSCAALPPVLARAAGVLDAPGLIVWLGAGEELFPATSHGYGPKALARLGPVPRSGDNATAAAWRAAAMSTVAGAPGDNGAIVAPLVGPDGCFGVLAAEVRNGRERDEATRAVTAMIAAQLSAVVAPWPAPSYAEGSVPGQAEQPAVEAGSDSGHDTPARAAATA